MRCILCYDSRREVKAKMKIDFDWLIMMPLSFLYIGIVFYYVKYKKRKVPYIIVFTLFVAYMAEVLKYTQFPICLNADMEELNRQCVNYIPFHFLSIEDVETFVLNIIITVPFGFLVPILYKCDWRKIIVSGILFGAITEIIQAGVEAFVGVNMHRIDMNDVIANFSGVVIGYAGYCLLRILLEKIFKNGNVKIECEKYLSDFCFLERYY